MFFEGSEKKIEVIFNKRLPGLRALPERYWKELALAARTRILSGISNSSLDAYLLSESSLFIQDHHLVMITCGTTQLVSAVRELINSFKPDDIDAFFYERKNELLPQAQSTDFFKDVRLLNRWFDGEVMRFGREDEHHLYLFASNKKYQPDMEDHTMEILMHGIDPRILKIFSENRDRNPEKLREDFGISDIVLGDIDDHIFDPAGYSLNAIHENHYFTIHITPEIHGSYTSFETNAFDGEKQMEWSGKVLNVFKPMSFDLMFFNNKRVRKPRFEHYILKRQYGDLIRSGYNVQYFSYYKPNEEEQKPVYLKELFH